MTKRKTTVQLIDEIVETIEEVAEQELTISKDHYGNKLYHQAVELLKRARERTLEVQLDALAAAFVDGYELTHK